MVRPFIFACLSAALPFSVPCAQAALDGRVPEPGMVTMADFGAESCLPCKAMAPILKKLDEEYEGRAAVRFINTVKYPEIAEYFRIAVLPTQIFYTHRGEEVGWHAGYLDEGSMRAKLDELIAAAKAEQASISAEQGAEP